MTESSLPYYNDPYEEPYTGRVYTTVFTAAGPASIEKGIVLADVGLFGVQTVLIDAAQYPSGATFRLEMLDSGVSYTLRGGSQVFLPALVGNVRASLRGMLSGAGTVLVHWLTTRFSTAVWNEGGGAGAGAVTWTQSSVVLAPATSATLIAANPLRTALRWMNAGANPFTAAPGIVLLAAGTGFSYNGAPAIGAQGGSDTFEGAVSQQAFSAISTLGTTVVIWEGV